MSVGMLCQQMRSLQVRSNVKCQAFSSRSSSICGKKLEQKPQQQQVQLTAVYPEIQCGKMKTRKAAAKRFSVSGNGKIRRRRPGKQHINEKMSRGKKRELSRVNVVNPRDVPNVAPNLPYSGVRQSRN